jgi:hypothetical protein
MSLYIYFLVRLKRMILLLKILNKVHRFRLQKKHNIEESIIET